MRFRFFSQADGPYIHQWMIDPDYFPFFRGCSLIPTAEECSNYPAWSQNMVMMIEDDGKVIGMAIGYHASWRNRTIKAGVLIDKERQKSKLGREAMQKWTQYLFSRGFRKVTLEFIDLWLVEPLKKLGFRIEGHYIDEIIGPDGDFVEEVRMSCFEGKKSDEPWEKRAAAVRSISPSTPDS